MSAARLVAAALAIGLAACTVTSGAVPEIADVTLLERGVSTRTDILRVLGEPSGSGHALLSPTGPEADIWVYERTVTGGGLTSTDYDLRMLLVFLQGDRYAGHLDLTAAANLKVEM